MRPIEKKLHYQVDKLVKSAVTGIGVYIVYTLARTIYSSVVFVCFYLCFNIWCFVLDENDPLRLKANPDNLMSKVLLKTLFALFIHTDGLKCSVFDSL